MFRGLGKNYRIGKGNPRTRAMKGGKKGKK
jgi:hypothetical protein